MANCKRNKRVRKVKQIDYSKDLTSYDDWFNSCHFSETALNQFHELLKESVKDYTKEQ